MKNYTTENIQTAITGATRNMAQMRDEIAAGNYSMAHYHALRAAESLLDAERWKFATIGTDNTATETEIAQIHSAAIERAQESAQEYEYNPESAQTVADLRQALKCGNADAAALVNDLISDNPNQATAWVTRTDIDEIADDLTDEQRGELMDYMRTEYELIDTSAEITNARETMDELEK